MKSAFVVLIFWLTGATAFAQPICLSIHEGLDRLCAREKSADVSCRIDSEKSLSDNSIVAWDEESCAYGSKSLRITEIEIPRKFDQADIEYVAYLPVTAVAKYGSQAVAQALISRRFQEFERPALKLRDITESGESLYNHVRPVMAIPAIVLDKILRRGFLNQHQTKTSHGCICADDRELTERDLLGLRLPDLDGTPSSEQLKYVFPKYAFAAFTSGSGLRIDGLTKQYGTTLVIFKRNVNKRTTITNGDTIEEDTVVAQTLYSPFSPASLKHVGHLHGYFETQIWGPLSIDNVSYLLTGCFDEDDSRVVIEALKAAGSSVPVYNCSKSSNGNETTIAPGRLLYGIPSR